MNNWTGILALGCVFTSAYGWIGQWLYTETEFLLSDGQPLIDPIVKNALVRQFKAGRGGLWWQPFICYLCLKLTIKIPEQCHWRQFGAFANFEQISHIILAFSLLALNFTPCCSVSIPKHLFFNFLLFLLWMFVCLLLLLLLLLFFFLGGG